MLQMYLNFLKKKMLLLTRKEPKSHQYATLCNFGEKHSYKSLLNVKNNVRDHCHFTGKYRDTA